MKIRIIAVVVTYNRKELLVECLRACLDQTFGLEQIIIINNASTDNTIEFLENSNLLKNSKIKLITLKNNEGSAGGFNKGIKLAMDNNPDLVWLMDDDCIPNNNSLEKLVNKYKFLKTKNKKVGFLCSQVNWIDGFPHLMNIPSISEILLEKPFSLYYKKNIFLIKSCSFVSVLFTKDAIKTVGLPIKEYFIWGDDVEYTNRISKAKFLNVLVLDSEVVHKTKINYSASIKEGNVNNAWRYFYSARNQFHQLKCNGFVGFLTIIRRYMLNLKDIKKRHDHKFLFFRKITGGCINGIFFNPKIEKCDNKN